VSARYAMEAVLAPWSKNDPAAIARLPRVQAAVRRVQDDAEITQATGLSREAALEEFASLWLLLAERAPEEHAAIVAELASK
jgi:hypothetical protein